MTVLSLVQAVHEWGMDNTSKGVLYKDDSTSLRGMSVASINFLHAKCSCVTLSTKFIDATLVTRIEVLSYFAVLFDV